MSIPPPFSEAAQGFDPTVLSTGAAAANEQREAIVKQFPRTDWPMLPVERYALGQGDVDTFCRWVEFRSDDLGSISGGSSLKLLISRNAKTGTWRYPDRYNSIEQAWSEVRSGFLKAFELAEQGNWDAIGGIEALKGAGALRTKALHIYFPDEVLPVYSKSHLEHYFKLVTGEEAQGNRLRSSRAILAALRKHPKLANLTTYQLGRFLYAWADPREQVRIVKIAPGEGAKFWSDCHKDGYICVGWDEIGDLRAFEEKADFRATWEEKYREIYKTKSKRTEKANEVWTLRELEPGDIVIANEGQSKVLAVGQVIEPAYQWSDRASYRHTVRVKWDTSYEQSLDSPIKSWATRTVAKVPAELYQQIVDAPKNGGKAKPGAGAAGVVRLPSTVVDPFLSEIGAALERKGQVILYGPPGTGKTYSARRFAVDFLLDAEGRTDRAAVLGDPTRFATEERRLSTSRAERRVFWAVANPSEWSWDRLFDDGRVEFKRGRLKKNYDLIQVDDLVVGYASNPTKRVLALARVAEVVRHEDQSTFILTPLRRVSQGPTWDELQKDKVLSASEPVRFNCQGTLFKLTPMEAEVLFERIGERDPAFEDPSEVGTGIGPLTRLTFHPSYSYEDFVEGFRPVDTGTAGLTLSLQDGVFKRICNAALARPAQRFLVLIDEINRANVAKVLGELITVLEHDKRGLSVTLPQSRENLVIPPNVYIVGTMNTADRSIKHMDAALRRRFAFIECLPDMEPLKGAEIDGLALDDLLEELNRRIVKREGREKQIGQSFLLDGSKPIADAAELARRFRYEILPLLQEYCHDDYAALADYLGNTLVDVEAQRLDETILERPELLVDALDKALLGQADPSE
jgi:5-methylcytosine-specific restriction protein B